MIDDFAHGLERLAAAGCSCEGRWGFPLPARLLFQAFVQVDIDAPLRHLDLTDGAGDCVLLAAAVGGPLRLTVKLNIAVLNIFIALILL